MTYFVNKRRRVSEPYRVVYPEVKARTSKGQPITFELIPLPEEYRTWEEALEASQQLNAGRPYSWQAGGLCPPSPF
jgi:hypothetical protein